MNSEKSHIIPQKYGCKTFILSHIMIWQKNSKPILFYIFSASKYNCVKKSDFKYILFSINRVFQIYFLNIFNNYQDFHNNIDFLYDYRIYINNYILLSKLACNQSQRQIQYNHVRIELKKKRRTIEYIIYLRTIII